MNTGRMIVPSFLAAIAASSPYAAGVVAVTPSSSRSGTVGTPSVTSKIIFFSPK